jgi:hypothetical protein
MTDKIYDDNGYFTDKYIDSLSTVRSYAHLKKCSDLHSRMHEDPEAVKKSRELAREVLPTDMFNNLVLGNNTFIFLEGMNMAISLSLCTTDVKIVDEKSNRSYCIIQDDKIPVWDRIVSLYLMAQNPDGIKKMIAAGNIGTNEIFVPASDRRPRVKAPVGVIDDYVESLEEAGRNPHYMPYNQWVPGTGWDDLHTQATASVSYNHQDHYENIYGIGYTEPMGIVNTRTGEHTMFKEPEDNDDEKETYEFDPETSTSSSFRSILSEGIDRAFRARSRVRDLIREDDDNS